MQKKMNNAEGAKALTLVEMVIAIAVMAVIFTAMVPVLAGDDEDTLAARVLATEHAIYPLAVRWFVEGRLRVDGGIVFHTGGASQVLI